AAATHSDQTATSGRVWMTGRPSPRRLSIRRTLKLTSVATADPCGPAVGTHRTLRPIFNAALTPMSSASLGCISDAAYSEPIPVATAPAVRPNAIGATSAWLTGFGSHHLDVTSSRRLTMLLPHRTTVNRLPTHAVRTRDPARSQARNTGVRIATVTTLGANRTTRST